MCFVCVCVWSTLKTALFGVNVAVPPLLRLDGSLTHCPKAGVLNIFNLM